MSATKYNDTHSHSGNPIGHRLKMEMKTRGISSAELAKRTDVKTSFIYDVISGKSANPSTVTLARVADGLGITLASLVEQPLADNAIERDTAAGKDNDYITLPWLAFDVAGTRIAGGYGEQEAQPHSYSIQWIKEQLGCTPISLRSLRVDGDSMEPALHHNDIVLVDIGLRHPSPPGIFVVYDGFGPVIKRIEPVMHSQPPRIRLFSDNPHYSTYENLLEDTRIIGRVVWLARRI